MGKITFSFPIETMAGSISKTDKAFSVRYRNGRPFTYTYTRTAPWSDKQHSTRALFGATSYFVHLIPRLDNAAEPLTAQMNNAKAKTHGKGVIVFGNASRHRLDGERESNFTHKNACFGQLLFIR